MISKQVFEVHAISVQALGKWAQTGKRLWTHSTLLCLLERCHRICVGRTGSGSSPYIYPILLMSSVHLLSRLSVCSPIASIVPSHTLFDHGDDQNKKERLNIIFIFSIFKII